ncbi:MAG: hypothetical protein ACE5JJ_10980, partial [Nitrospinota bacterium]
MSLSRELRPLGAYVDFGVRLHLSDFANLTGVVLLFFLPLAAIIVQLYPPLGQIARGGGLPPGYLFNLLMGQVLLRVLQSFIFTLVVLRAERMVEPAARGEEPSWDFAGALARFPLVAAVDLVYLLMVSVGLMLLVVPGVVLALRFYFCSYIALFRRLAFPQYFARAAGLARGVELKLAALYLLYQLVSQGVAFLLLGFLGVSPFSHIVVNAAAQVVLLSYFFAAYRLYLDL